MENLTNLDDIVNYLDNLNFQIVEQKNLSVEDLKNLLLIIYNEYLIDSKNPLIKSLILITLKHFVDLENLHQNGNNENKYEKSTRLIIDDFTHMKLRNMLRHNMIEEASK